MHYDNVGQLKIHLGTDVEYSLVGTQICDGMSFTISIMDSLTVRVDVMDHVGD
jgi:hypothetical protein